MAVDGAWLEQNLGGPPKKVESIGTTATEASADVGLTPQVLALQRIDFDGQAPEALARNAAWPAPPPTLTHYVAVDWPQALAPQLATQAPNGEALPPADVLIVTWTLEEAARWHTC